MNKCSICGVKQVETSTCSLEINGESVFNIPLYNIDLLTFIKGKEICNKCMDTYYKIKALKDDIDFSCGKLYYADGRNLG